MWLVAIIRKKHEACFFSLQPLSIKETKSGSIMFKKMWQTVSCLQKHDSIMFAKKPDSIMCNKMLPCWCDYLVCCAVPCMFK